MTGDRSPMQQAATRESWKTLPIPLERANLELELPFTAAEGERMRLGHIPEEMEDKWFMFFEDGWLYFHRSWTGICVYAIRIEASPDGVTLTGGWASRESTQ